MRGHATLRKLACGCARAQLSIKRPRQARNNTAAGLDRRDSQSLRAPAKPNRQAQRDDRRSAAQHYSGRRARSPWRPTTPAPARHGLPTSPQLPRRPAPARRARANPAAGAYCRGGPGSPALGSAARALAPAPRNRARFTSPCCAPARHRPSTYAPGPPLHPAYEAHGATPRAQRLVRGPATRLPVSPARARPGLRHVHLSPVRAQAAPFGLRVRAGAL